MPKDMLFDAFQVVLYNLIIRMVQQAREFRGRKIAKCSCHSENAGVKNTYNQEALVGRGEGGGVMERTG